MASGRSLLRFQGAPTRLTATLLSPPGLDRSGRLVLADRPPVPLTVRRLPSTEPPLAVLTVRLPKSTPPGEYAGKAELGGAEIPAVIEVEARSKLRFFPSKIVAREQPGARLRAEVTVLNLGNVDIAIEPESTFCLFDIHGLERALYKALTEKEADGERRIGRVLDELAQSHGGLVRAVVQKGAGALAPEEVRRLTAEFQFSPRMRAGETYRGAWMISEASLEIAVETTGE